MRDREGTQYLNEVLALRICMMFPIRSIIYLKTHFPSASASRDKARLLHLENRCRLQVVTVRMEDDDKEQRLRSDSGDLDSVPSGTILIGSDEKSDSPCKRVTCTPGYPDSQPRDPLASPSLPDVNAV